MMSISTPSSSHVCQTHWLPQFPYQVFIIKRSGGRIVENETGNPVTPSTTKSSATKVKSVGPTGWGANRDGTEQPKPSATKSFSEIQQEEETF